MSGMLGTPAATNTLHLAQSLEDLFYGNQKPNNGTLAKMHSMPLPCRAVK